ncbi:hypothetical protein ABIA35_004976 [Catenulispora sp. MAP12-49]|uniref:hypothetical protein n=1 Tax=unclassified Catenulispora TaxID=414885 RepID=UPI0035131068
MSATNSHGSSPSAPNWLSVKVKISVTSRSSRTAVRAGVGAVRLAGRRLDGEHDRHDEVREHQQGEDRLFGERQVRAAFGKPAHELAQADQTPRGAFRGQGQQMADGVAVGIGTTVEQPPGRPAARPPPSPSRCRGPGRRPSPATRRRPSR